MPVRSSSILDKLKAGKRLAPINNLENINYTVCIQFVYTTWANFLRWEGFYLVYRINRHTSHCLCRIVSKPRPEYIIQEITFRQAQAFLFLITAPGLQVPSWTLVSVCVYVLTVSVWVSSRFLLLYSWIKVTRKTADMKDEWPRNGLFLLTSTPYAFIKCLGDESLVFKRSSPLPYFCTCLNPGTLLNQSIVLFLESVQAPLFTSALRYPRFFNLPCSPHFAFQSLIFLPASPFGCLRIGRSITSPVFCTLSII